MYNEISIIPYIKIALAKTKFFSIILGILAIINFLIPSLATFWKANILVILFIIYLFVVLWNTIKLILQDTIAPKILQPFSNKSLEDKYGILFITAAPAYKSIYEIGSLISLVFIENEIETIIGDGVIINIQANGKMQIGINLLNDFNEYKDKIQNRQDNIYIKPKKMGIFS